MKKYLLLLSALVIIGCKQGTTDTAETNPSDTLSVEEREYKVLDSEYIDLDVLWAPFIKDMEAFSKQRYEALKSIILEQDIPSIQNAIDRGDLTYEELSLFYLERIRTFDRINELSLNSVIALNPDIINEAREKDRALKEGGRKHAIYGIPVLLKDNINTENLPTTAGAEALAKNVTKDAFLVERLKENGALILGKANLSEWAYFFCGDCPSGYSAIGGQTLNPYGRKILDTGGSSAGSAVAVAANFAPVAVGTETAGSILSPSSQGSLVGLKPTVGVISRGGIVPISASLDTPGPITKSVIDNAILLSAMTGEDAQDPASLANQNKIIDFYQGLKNASLKGKKFGVMKGLMGDALYVQAVEDLKKGGAEIIEYETEEVQLPNFINYLNLEMKGDLPKYFKNYGDKDLKFESVQDVVAYNQLDSLRRAPYGQKLFQGIIADTTTEEKFIVIEDTLVHRGKRFFERPMDKYKLDGILSINNFHAAYAAVAKFPAITVSMGYTEEKAPKGLTIIGRPYQESELLKWAYVYEQVSKRRRAPENYH
ncbi:MAG: amidase family protein [Flavobacteriaceae bacterium]